MAYTYPNYAAITELGDVRRRIWRITADNPLNGQPLATAHEEIAALAKNEAGDTVQVSVGHVGGELTATAADPDRVVDLRDPVTDAVIGQTTIGAIHAHIYSLGRDMQTQRDIAEVARLAAIAAAEAEV